MTEPRTGLALATDDPEYDGDGVTDPDLEPSLGSTGSYNAATLQDFWASGDGTDECEEENEHAESAGYGDGCVDCEPMLGATEDIDQRRAWARQSWPAVEDGEAQGTEDDLVRPDRTDAEENAQRAAVQEAIGRLSELTGARAYGGAYGRVRFYRKDEINTVDGVRFVGVVR